MIIEYISNNSGGGWWLKDEDWINLEKAGWNVVWGGHLFCKSQCSWGETYNGKQCKGNCHGHRKFESYKDVTDEDRWIGALAKEASKEFETMDLAIQEFEKITGQIADEEGCECCGNPHNFYQR